MQGGGWRVRRVCSISLTEAAAAAVSGGGLLLFALMRHPKLCAVHSGARTHLKLRLRALQGKRPERVATSLFPAWQTINSFNSWHETLAS